MVIWNKRATDRDTEKRRKRERQTETRRKEEKESETDIQTEKKQRNGEGEIGRQSKFALYYLYNNPTSISHNLHGLIEN